MFARGVGGENLDSIAGRCYAGRDTCRFDLRLKYTDLSTTSGI